LFTASVGAFSPLTGFCAGAAALGLVWAVARATSCAAALLIAIGLSAGFDAARALCSPLEEAAAPLPERVVGAAGVCADSVHCGALALLAPLDVSRTGFNRDGLGCVEGWFAAG
jgi:hypothetical protein